MWLKRLRDWLNSYLTCVKVYLGRSVIPREVGEEERLMRTIFHPANFNEKKGTLKSNFMKPPAEPDEEDSTITSNKLSTTRYDYAGMRFCRDHAQSHQCEPRRHYWGFGRFVVNELKAPRLIDNREYTCLVQCRPVEDNPAHANINLGFRTEVGVPLDGQVQEYIKQLADSAEIWQDPDPTSEEWKGKVIDDPMYGTLKYKGEKNGASS